MEPFKIPPIYYKPVPMFALDTFYFENPPEADNAVSIAKTPSIEYDDELSDLIELAPSVSSTAQRASSMIAHVRQTHITKLTNLYYISHSLLNERELQIKKLEKTARSDEDITMLETCKKNYELQKNITISIQSKLYSLGHSV